MNVYFPSYVDYATPPLHITIYVLKITRNLPSKSL